MRTFKIVTAVKFMLKTRSRWNQTTLRKFLRDCDFSTPEINCSVWIVKHDSTMAQQIDRIDGSKMQNNENNMDENINENMETDDKLNTNISTNTHLKISNQPSFNNTSNKPIEAELLWQRFKESRYFNDDLKAHSRMITERYSQLGGDTSVAFDLLKVLGIQGKTNKQTNKHTYTDICTDMPQTCHRHAHTCIHTHISFLFCFVLFVSFVSCGKNNRIAILRSPTNTNMEVKLEPLSKYF